MGVDLGQIMIWGGEKQSLSETDLWHIILFIKWNYSTKFLPFIQKPNIISLKYE